MDNFDASSRFRERLCGTTMRHVVVDSFEDWRGSARALLGQEIPPEAVQWSDRSSGAISLFDEVNDNGPVDVIPAPDRSVRRVRRAFIELVRSVAFHRRPSRWRLPYSLCGN
jgi:hypothetical protein